MTDGQSTNEYCPLTAAQRRYLPLKRALDILLALLSLLVLAAPMLIIAAAVKLTGPGQPVLFRQQRVGRSGELFTLCKFRSMDQGRVTPVGRFLRTASLDELPQLWQVLTGQMSLVGPRPLALYDQAVHALRQASGVYQLRPGLTGLAQINGRDMLPPAEKAAYDREYLRTFSFRTDARILAATVGKVLRRVDIEEK